MSEIICNLDSIIHIFIMEMQKPIISTCRNIIFLLCCCLPIILSAQAQKMLSEQPEQTTYFMDQLDNVRNVYPVVNHDSDLNRNHSIMLPVMGSDHASPLFCRLEEKINEGNNLQCLFRLGSVSYVNYLERKGDHQRLMLEQMRQ